jgi:cytosine/adenosine deaminase-related metal-dependent hydrolase
MLPRSDATTYTALWIFPVDGPPLERGCITVEGERIVAVAAHGTRTADTDLGNVAIVPGFVNAHTHLDLSGARRQCPPTPDFTQWLRKVIAFRRSRTPEQVQADIAAGIAESVRYGVTLLGDIASGGLSWDLLRSAPCRTVVFYELLGLTEERARQSREAAEAWRAQHPGTLDCVPGFSPHAPYSVLSTQYSVLGKRSEPTATHLAESREEIQLLRNHDGPFVDFLKELNVWHPAGLIRDPLDVVRALPRGLFIHGNYLDADTSFTSQQSVILCPRTHQAFGHARHPFPRMNVRVALGTDSLASNPDLDILAEARLLRWQYPEVAPSSLLRMLSLSGAEALGFDRVTGSLTPGKSADLVVLPLANTEPDDPHDLIFDSEASPSAVMFRGSWRTL